MVTLGVAYALSLIWWLWAVIWVIPGLFLTLTVVGWITAPISPSLPKKTLPPLAPRAVMTEEEEMAHAWLELSGVHSKHPWSISMDAFVTLMHEWPHWEIAAESPAEQPEEEIDEMFYQISAATELSAGEMALADFSLLAVIEGLIPPPEGVGALRSVFGDELADSVLARSASGAQG